MHFKTMIVGTIFLGKMVFAESPVDDFGFQKFYTTRTGSLSWTSAHWNNGNDRTFSDWSTDPDDPTGWTSDQSGSAQGFHVDGSGVMQMLGNAPRFHINSNNDEDPTSTSQFFLNVEYTAYFMRNALGGENWGGMIVGLRSGSHHHGSSGRDNCLANTYYARFRNDGTWDFEKEWKHPGSYYRSTSGIGKQDPLWGGGVLPVKKWIGMKFIVYNPNASTVRLELYIDSTSNATAPGNWELVGIAEDAGLDWSGASYGASTIEGCAYSDALAPILQGGGTALMRSDNDNPYYKYVSIREIDPTGSFDDTGIRPRAKPLLKSVPVRHFDLLGRSQVLEKF